MAQEIAREKNSEIYMYIFMILWEEMYFKFQNFHEFHAFDLEKCYITSENMGDHRDLQKGNVNVLGFYLCRTAFSTL